MYSITNVPNSSPMVAALSCPFRWVSGIISSLMTYSIAPAANPIAYGRIACMVVTAHAPKTASGISPA